jgi:hypothetical protein
MCLVWNITSLLTISEGFATDGDIAMPIPINAGTVYQNDLIAQDEINEITSHHLQFGLFVKTPVNK